MQSKNRAGPMAVQLINKLLFFLIMQVSSSEIQSLGVRCFTHFF